jgi:prolyl oligopeptidase
MSVTVPQARPRPEEQTIGGVSYVDPFVWLEHNDDPEVRAWQDAQDERARAYLSSVPDQERLRSTVERGFVNMFAYYAPQRFGDKWWRQVVPAGKRLPVLEMADTPTGAGRVVLDLNALSGEKTLLLVLWKPSPDNRRLAYVFSEGGASVSHLRVLDIESGELLIDGLPLHHALFTAWLPDSSGFYTNAMEMDAGPDGLPVARSAVYLVRLDGSEPERQVSDLPLGVAIPMVSPDGRWVTVSADYLNPRPFYIKVLRGGDWQPFLGDQSGSFKGVVIGDRYICITDDAAPRGRLISIPLATPADRSTWTELIPAGEAKLASITAVGERIILVDFVDAAARIRVLRPDGSVESEVPLPGNGGVGKFALQFILSFMDDIVAGGKDECTFVYSSLTQAPTVYRYDLNASRLETLVPPKLAIEGAATTEHHATSKDGTAILYRVAALGNDDLSAPRPTIIYGYGGYNVSWLPAYMSLAAAWVALGGVFVHTHLRGGGEFGTEWWQGGRMHTKQNTFDDLLAVAEDLIRRGITSPDMLGVFGSSNGGLLAGVALTQRPDLFRAALPQVPILDLLRMKIDPDVLAIALADYGNPDDPADAPVLFAHSPYHNVREGTSYPAVLLDCGANDTTCPAWHARKFAARLQECTTSDHPILLRVREGTGHNAMTDADFVERDVEELAFFARELGLSH